MGGALLSRWQSAGLDGITVVDPIATPPGARVLTDIPADGSPDILVLAVKPQVWRECVGSAAGRLAPGTTVVSIMAGVAIASLQAAIPAARIVRAMPNTPARIGRGVTALFTTAGTDSRQHAETLFTPAGTTVWLDSEADFDAVTGLSGSGPAYVFAMIDALAAAGEGAGLCPDLAARLALVTVSGASALAAEGTATPGQLRDAVTSPNGTTAAGLAVLMPELAQLLAATVAAATARSRQLAMD